MHGNIYRPASAQTYLVPQINSHFPMAQGSARSMQPSTAATYSFQIKPLSSVNPTLQPAPRYIDSYHETNRLQESGFANYQGPSCPQIDLVINILCLEKIKQAETLAALQSSRKSSVQLQNLLHQERTSNQRLRLRAQEAEMKRIFVEEQLRAYGQQDVVCA